MKNKPLLLGAIAVLAALLVWLFFIKKPATNTRTEKVKITILGENSATIQAMMSLEKEYEDQNPAIDLDFKPNTFDDAFNKSNQDFANKTGLYDIIMQYNFSLSSFVRNNYVYGIDELSKYVSPEARNFEKDLYENNWKEVGYYYKDDSDPSKGEVKVAYPFSAHSMLVMYNKSMFDDSKYREDYKKKYGKELSIPTTWEDFYNIAQFFTRSESKTYGVCVGGASGGYLYYDFMNFVYGMGGRILDKNVGWEGDINTKVVVNSPETLKALKFYTSLKPYNAGNFTSIDQYEPIRLMKENNTAMAIVWSDLIYPAIKTQAGLDIRFGFAPIPGDKAIFVGGAYFISRYTKHPKETFEYITWLMQDKTQVELAKRGLCPSSKITYDNPDVKALPYTSALQKSIEKGGVILEAGPDANMISEVITTYVQKVWNNELSPEKALSQAQSEIETKRKEIFQNITKQ